MKLKLIRNFLLILICGFSLLILSGCDKIINEIYNKSYDIQIDADDISEGVSFAVEKAKESVIGVMLFEKNSALIPYKEGAAGSGVIYSCSTVYKDGTVRQECAADDDIDHYQYKVLTNRHVVESSSKYRQYYVYLNEENQTIEADLMGISNTVDLAILSFSTKQYIKPIEIADSDTLKSGMLVVALGNPKGNTYYSSATLGIVSHPKRYLAVDTNDDGVEDFDTELIQHDAAINPGNSGGALINLKGQLVGINVMKLVESDIENIGFAIATNLVKKHIPYLEDNKQMTSLKLDLYLIDVDKIINRHIYSVNYNIPDVKLTVNYGVYVADITSKSAVNNLLKKGDIVLEINDNLVYRKEQLYQELYNWNNEGNIKLLVLRNGEAIEVTN